MSMRKLAEETRAANLEIAKQIGLLKALNLDVNLAWVKELRDGVSQINAQLDAFSTRQSHPKCPSSWTKQGSGSPTLAQSAMSCRRC